MAYHFYAFNTDGVKVFGNRSALKAFMEKHPRGWTQCTELVAVDVIQSKYECSASVARKKLSEEKVIFR